MRLRTCIVALAVVPVVALPSSVAVAGSPTSTDLVGAEEVPGPGDPDASGFADLSLKKNKGTVCYDLSWADVDGTVTAAHIHVGEAGVAGPVVVPLPATGEGSSGSASGCTSADKALITTIRKNPADYYVNVHSTTWPAGAVRGQLG